MVGLLVLAADGHEAQLAQELEQLIELDQLRNLGANVLLFRPPGVGKSHLGSALGLGLIDAGRRVLFKRCSDLVQRVQAARRDLRLPQELAKLDRFDVLIPDALS